MCFGTPFGLCPCARYRLLGPLMLCHPTPVPAIPTRHDQQSKRLYRLKGDGLSDRTAQKSALWRHGRRNGQGRMEGVVAECTKASSWPTKKGKMRAADATLAGPLDPVTELLIGRPVWLDRLLLMGPAVSAILRVPSWLRHSELEWKRGKRRGPVCLSVVSFPSPTAATKCYAPIAHCTPSRTQGTVRSATP